MILFSLEVYLESIYKTKQKEEEIRPLTIAKELKVPVSRVVQAMQRLHYQKYLVYSPYRSIKLTQKGIDTGKYLDTRNKLIREFLELLNITGENLENEIEAMKQYLSHETIDALEKFILFNRKYPEVSYRYKLLFPKFKEGQLLYKVPDKKI